MGLRTRHRMYTNEHATRKWAQEQDSSVTGHKLSNSGL